MTRRPGARAALLAACVLLALAAGAVLLRPRDRGAARFDEYAGEATCIACHQEQRAFLGTAHQRSSAPAGPATIAGSFAPGENTLATTNPYLHFRMEARGDGFHQTAVVGMPPDTTLVTRRMDLVVGSGRKGQTYLYWRGGDRLYQLPVSYWTSLDDWISSPSYPEGVANFERAVAPRCLECHATYFQPVADSGAANRYHPARQITGISCERCHGPGGEHVRLQRQRSPLGRLLRSAAVAPSELSRRRQLELCAQCHGGVGEPVAPPFSYRPGERLDRHLRLAPPPDPRAAVDVHGNQVALLARSPCFLGSEMTCSTCHDVHRTERDPAALSGRCLSCHQVRSCGLFPERGQEIAGRCVDCHMPELPSNSIIARRDGEPVQPRVRTHWIRVYGADEAR